jgi:hypothetical protein
MPLLLGASRSAWRFISIGYHDFCLGPQGQKRTGLPQGEALLDSALDVLEESVLFAKVKLK